METKDNNNIEATRKFLTSTLETSKAIASSLDESGSRLKLLNKKCLSLQTSLKLISMQSFSFCDVENGMNSVLCSVSAVVKVFQCVNQLENSLLIEPSYDFFTYVSNTKKLEEALKLLTDNCKLASCWLRSVFEKKPTYTNDIYLLNVEKVLRILQELQAIEDGARLDRGILSIALDKLEISFHKLLMSNTMPLPLVSLIDQPNIIEKQGFPFPSSLTSKFQVIAERLNANNRLDKCQSMYVEVRGMNARRSLKTIDLSYLEIPISEFEDAHGIESCIEQWSIHLELVVEKLLEVEFMLSSIIFEKISPEASMKCFAKIAIESGIFSFIKFGKFVSERKNEPLKLLNLLSMFRVLNGLRLKFNKLFRGEACEEIRIVIKDLITRVVNCASDIFFQLSEQVKLQRPSCPPSDGSVPRLVSFVTNYCNKLLSDEYKPHLIQVLEIHLSWKKELYEEGIFWTQIYSIIKEVALNLDVWSKAYEDITLSYFFMMNNHCHFYNLKGTLVGNMMGDSWLKAHEQYKEYYASLYLRNSWGNLQNILVVQKDIVSSSMIFEDLAKRLKTFNLAFDERYKKECKWIIIDEILRENICKHLVEGIVPIYKVYLKNYILCVESDDGVVDKHIIKYTAKGLENKIWSLFQPKMRKHGDSIKHKDLISKIKEVSHHFRLSLVAL
ncbi:exocyst complex component EXO70I [Cicer arietinum]|uniref:Exocyst subunit Exo70 family protein n=1 Tax=Cicer arietinum TaxID=3827 RepID=A0A1S2YNK3_CICAR|nr:exocyst complex component EXO70A1 [Cicer arietinum]